LNVLTLFTLITEAGNLCFNPNSNAMEVTDWHIYCRSCRPGQLGPPIVIASVQSD